jgi:CHAT domain-containing protein/tetratricopeptide (TPR) repeat protein
MYSMLPTGGVGKCLLAVLAVVPAVTWLTPSLVAQAPAAGAPPAATLSNGKPAEITYADRFDQDSRTRYDTTGSVTWREGTLTLGPKSTLFGGVGTGPAIDFSIKVGAPSEADAMAASRVALGLRMTADYRVLIRLERVQTDGRLVDRIAAASVTPQGRESVLRTADLGDGLGGNRAGVWKLRYNHGIVELQHDGMPILFADAALADLAPVGVELRCDVGTLDVRSLEILAAGPAAPLTPAEVAAKQALIPEWEQAAAEAGRLFRAETMAQFVPAQQKLIDLYAKLFGPESMQTLDAGNQLALALDLLGRYAEAEALLAKNLPIYRRKLGDRHTRTADCRRNLGDALRHLGRTTEAVPHVKAAAETYWELHGPKSEHTSLAWDVYAELLDTVGDRAGAVAAGLRSVESRGKTFGEGSPEEVAAMQRLGRFHLAAGDGAAARKQYEQTWNAAKAARGPDDPTTLEAESSLAAALRFEHDWVAARRHFEHVLAVRMRDPSRVPPTAVETLGSLASLQLELGDVETAERLTKQAVEVAAALQPPDASIIAEAAGRLGSLHLARGRLDEAEAAYARMQAAYESLGPSGRGLAAGAVRQRGDVEFHRGRFSEAQARYREAEKLDAAFRGPNEQRTADFHAKVGWAALLGGDLATAERDLTEAHRLLAAAGRHRSTDAAMNLTYLGQLAEARKQFAEAVTLHERALAIYREIRGELHPQTAFALAALATSHRLSGDWVQAFGLQREAFDVRLRLGRDTLGALAESESLLHVAQLQETRDSLLADYRFVRSTPKEVLRTQLKTVPEIDPRNVYELIAESKGLASRAVAGRRPAADATEEVQATWGKLNAVRAKLAARLTRSGDTSTGKENDALWDALTREKEACERDLARLTENPAVYDEPAGDWVERIGRALDAETTVVDFVRSTMRSRRVAGQGENSAESFYDAFVIRRLSGGEAELAWVSLGPAGPIDEAVGRWNLSVAGRGSDVVEAAAPPPPWQEASAVLRKLVWDPIASHLGSATTVLVVPDGALHRVAFGALPSDDGAGFLLESRAFAVLADVRQVFAKPRPTTSGGELLLVGGVAYDRRPAERQIATAEPVRGHPPAAPRATWKYLPGAAREVEEIAGIGSSNLTVRPLGADAAAEPAVKQALPRSRIAHFATHGYVALPDSADETSLGLASAPGSIGRTRPTLRNPLAYTGIVLSGADLPAEVDATGFAGSEDGLLTAEEVVGLDLANVELVTLSACDTARGAMNQGEGVFGLQRGFAGAGARSVVAGLWQVDDDATRVLMVEFYRNLWDKKLGKLAAMRNAQLSMIRRYDGERKRLADSDLDPSRRTSPHYWAAFVLSGEWK